MQLTQYMTQNDNIIVGRSTHTDTVARIIKESGTHADISKSGVGSGQSL